MYHSLTAKAKHESAARARADLADESAASATAGKRSPRASLGNAWYAVEMLWRRRGDGLGILRDVIIADSDAEAIALWRDSGMFSGRAWFEPFGFRKGVVDPVTGKAPASPEESIAKGYALVGTVDTVTRTLEAIRRRLPVDWVFCDAYNSLVPHRVLMKSIERFWTEVMPRVA